MEDDLKKHEVFWTAPLNVKSFLLEPLVQLLEVSSDILRWLLDLVVVAGSKAKGPNRNPKQEKKDESQQSH